MAQPSVTRAIQELERYYGVQLFERLNHRLSITPAGRALYTQALQIVDSFDLLEKGLRDWDELGTLRVGASITLGCVLMPELAAAFQEKHPGFRVEVKVMSAALLCQGLLDNTLDLALVEGGVTQPELEMREFREDRLVLLLPPGDPLLQKCAVTVAELKDRSLLLRESGSVGRSLVEHVFAAHGLPLTPLWESASTSAILRAVHRGLGISFLPEELARPALDAGLVATLPVADADLSRKSYILWHRHKFLTASAREFITLCETQGRGAPGTEG